MQWSNGAGAVVLLMGLTGCVFGSPPPPPQIPLVAVPGPAKQQAEFQQDDTACRAQAAAAPVPATSAPATAPTTTGLAALGPQQVPPGAIYLRCMESRNNLVAPLAPSSPVLYGYYSPYPIYAGFGDTYPWGYGGYYGVGFYGGYGRGFGGYDRFGFRGGDFGHGGRPEFRR